MVHTKLRSYVVLSLPCPKAQEAVTLYNLAYLERNRGHLNSALTNIDAAITIVEDY